MNNNSLAFTQMPLARSGDLRKDESWYKEKLFQQRTCFVFIFNGQCLLVDNALFLPQLSKDNISRLQALNCEFHCLGIESNSSGHAVFSCELTANIDTCNDIVFGTNSPQHFQWCEFRASLSFLSSTEMAIVGYAKALQHWHKAYQFCGYCGGETQSKESGHARQCINESCKKELFPRTDPVVIMLVEHKDKDGQSRCLLANHSRSPELLYSTLAGFVDPGESLEEAVVREVQEEAGLEVEAVEYINSQPWPFPNSIMLGFFAKVNSDQLSIDKEELRVAKWFTASEVEMLDDWGSGSGAIEVPREESIARYLINTWLARQKAV